VTIGVALIRLTTPKYGITEFTDPVALLRMIRDKWRPLVVSLEMYTGSGPVGKEGALTIRQEGYLYYSLCEAGITVVRRSAQSRKHQLERAVELIPNYNDKKRHKRDALAHALAVEGKEFR